MMMKVCSKCNRNLPATTEYFYKQKSGKYGLISQCKNCVNISNKKWRDTNPEKKKDCNANWRINNQDKIKEDGINYYKNNFTKINIKNKNWKKNNPEKVKIIAIKQNARRKRNLGWELLFENPFPPEVLINYHHISDGFVVALPGSLHSNHLHGMNKQLHRDELQPYVEAIYDISYIII